jgi:hypothetical protein
MQRITISFVASEFGWVPQIASPPSIDAAIHLDVTQGRGVSVRSDLSGAPNPMLPSAAHRLGWILCNAFFSHPGP